MAAAGVDKTEFRQIRDTVYTFFYYSNKPVGVTEIVLQFKNHSKKMIESILDDLVAKKMIILKPFGKVKIYCLAQEMTFKLDEDIYTPEIDKEQDQSIEDKLLRYLKWNCDRHAKELAILKETNRSLDAKLAVYDNQMSVEELTRSIKDLKEFIKEYEGSDKKDTISAADFNRRKREHTLAKKEFTKRSNAFKEIVSGLCDGLGKSKAELLLDSGIEEETPCSQ